MIARFLLQPSNVGRSGMDSWLETFPLIEGLPSGRFRFLYLLILFSLLSLSLRCLLRQKQSHIFLPQGYTRLGIRGHSNLADEHGVRYASGTGRDNNISADSACKVKALFIHPIKSCGEIELDTADIDEAGMIFDRKFAFAELVQPPSRLDASDTEKQPRWTFRTLRQPGWEKLVHVKPEVWLRQKNQNLDGKSQPDGCIMVVKYPHIPSGAWAPMDRVMMMFRLRSSESSFCIPFMPRTGHQYPVEKVTIWKDSPLWLNYGVHLPLEFRAFLGARNPITMFRADPESYRQVFRCAPRKDEVGYQPVVGFADAYPLHLLNLTSVRDLAGKVQKDIPLFTARRFRSNIIISGPESYEEDNWKRIRIGQHEMFCACRTIRCRLPNVDPDTSFRHPIEPDKTLRSFRCIDDGDPMNAAMGLQLVPGEARAFQIRVGDKIDVLERGEHHYIKQ